MKTDKLSFFINGEQITVESEPMARLLDILRRDCGLTGAKEGCGEGECGACAVLIDGELVNSCLVPIGQIVGCEITTIEGAFECATGNRLKNSFLAKGASQCGACTPGMVMASLVLLRANSQPNLEDVKKALAGNICRCTGYTKIFEAVLDAVQPSGNHHV